MFIAQALWARRIQDAGATFASECRVRAYGNAKTLASRKRALENAGVEVVEVSDVREAADERLMSDVYSRARDALDEGNASELAAMVVTSDARLSTCIAQARARGVHTIVVSDFLRNCRSKMEFQSAFVELVRARFERDVVAYAHALQVVVSYGKVFETSILATSADVALIWDPFSVIETTQPERDTHNAACGKTRDDFGQVTAAPGGVIATLRPENNVDVWRFHVDAS